MGITCLLFWACGDDTPAYMDGIEMMGGSESMGGAGGVGAGAGAGTGAGATTGTGAGATAGTGTEAGTGATAGTGAGATAGTGTEAGTTAGTGTEAGITAGTGTEAGATAGTGTEGGTTAGTEAGTTAGTGAGAECQTLADWTPPDQRGFIYLTHFLTSEVIRYRVDGELPEEDLRFNVGGEPHDAALDHDHSLYAVALNLSQTVELYQLPREEIEGALPAPQLLSTIGLSPYTPRRVLFDSARARLFVLANAPLDEGLLDEMYLFVYDVSQPDAPIALSPEPALVPVTTTLAIEPRAGTLALVELSTHHLWLYDIGNGRPTLRPGDPIDLLAEFPEEGGQDAFQVRNLRFDPIRGRMLMARAQGIASEVIMYAYPPLEPKPDGADAGCVAAFGYSDLTQVEDDFEVETPIAERSHLLGGFIALPLLGENFTLFVNYAWRVNSIASMVTLMSEDQGGRLRNLSGCGGYDDFGCFYTSYFNNQPSTYNHLTDGAACVDRTHGVFAGVGLEDDENSELFLFTINRERGELTPMLSERGRNLSTAAYPLHLGCH